MPCANPRIRHTTLARTPVIPAQAGIQRCPAGPSRVQTTPRCATPRRAGALREPPTAANRPPPTHDTPPRRGGFETRPLHQRSVNPRAPIVIPSEAEGSKTIALRQPSKPPHNPRTFSNSSQALPPSSNPPPTQIVIPAQAGIQGRRPQQQTIQRQTALPQLTTHPRVGAGLKPARSIHARSTRARLLSSRAKPRDLRLLPCANPRSRHATHARTPVIPVQAGIQRCPAGPSRGQTTPRCATPHLYAARGGQSRRERPLPLTPATPTPAQRNPPRRSPAGTQRPPSVARTCSRTPP